MRSYDEGLAGDSGYIVTPELNTRCPTSSVIAMRSVCARMSARSGWRMPPSTTTQESYTQLNDVGGRVIMRPTRYSAAQFLLLKAQVAHSYGGTGGAQSW